MTALLSTYKISATDEQKNEMPMKFTEGVVRSVFIYNYNESVLTITFTRRPVNFQCTFIPRH
jgi:hypothetical protein